MSAPTQNARVPAPVMTTARTSGSASSWSQISLSRACAVPSTALSTCWRSMTTVATWFSMVRVTSSTLVFRLWRSPEHPQLLQAFDGGSASKPFSSRTSTLCSPSRGATRRTVGGVAESRMGALSILTVPTPGCSASTIMPLACVCASARACSRVCTGALRRPWSSSWPVQYSVLLVAMRSRKIACSAGLCANCCSRLANSGRSVRSSSRPRASEIRASGSGVKPPTMQTAPSVVSKTPLSGMAPQLTS